MKTHQTNGSIQIPSNIIRDSSISLAQKGLYGIITYYDQLPGFSLNRRYICVHHQIGEYSLKSDLNKLKEKNYAACERIGSKWNYTILNNLNENGYTLIPRTLLSSNIPLAAIGLYMIITYCITLPDVRPGIQLYSSYCSDCDKKVKVISSDLQAMKLYLPEKLHTASYIYRLYEPHSDGTYHLLHEVIPASKRKVIDIVESQNFSAKSTSNLEESTPSSSTVSQKPVTEASDTELLDNLKKALHYEYFTTVSNPADANEVLQKDQTSSIMTLLLQSILHARNAEYVKSSSNLKLYYKKYYENYILPLADTYTLECLLHSIADALARTKHINDINAYITAIVIRNVPYYIAKSSSALLHNYNDDIELYGPQINDMYLASGKKQYIYDQDTDIFLDQQSQIA